MARKKKNYIIDGEGFTAVYVDGCCLNPDQKVRASGYGVYFGPKSSRNFGACKRNATNNIAEIQSATVAIQQAKTLGIAKLRIFTDSQFVLDKATEWIAQWKSNNMHHVETSREYNKLYNVMHGGSDIEVKFEWIPAHSGNQNHNEADKLAKKGAEAHCNYQQIFATSFAKLSL